MNGLDDRRWELSFAISITVKYMIRPVRNLASLAAIDHFGFTTGTFPFSFSLLLAGLTLDHDIE